MNATPNAARIAARWSIRVYLTVPDTAASNQRPPIDGSAGLPKLACALNGNSRRSATRSEAIALRGTRLMVQDHYDGLTSASQ